VSDLLVHINSALIILQQKGCLF